MMDHEKVPKFHSSEQRINEVLGEIANGVAKTPL